MNDDCVHLILILTSMLISQNQHNIDSTHAVEIFPVSRLQTTASVPFWTLTLLCFKIFPVSSVSGLLHRSMSKMYNSLSKCSTDLQDGSLLLFFFYFFGYGKKHICCCARPGSCRTPTRETTRFSAGSSDSDSLLAKRV